MTIFFTSDTHFLHNNIIPLENRPFDGLGDMEDTIVQNWNNVVTNDDTIFHIGDFVLGNFAKWKGILPKLNGQKTLVQGNHDSSKVVKRLLNEGYLHELHEVGVKLKIEGFILWLSHYPMEIGHRPKMYNLHGHIHSKPSSYLNQVNVGVDSSLLRDRPFGQPVSLEELLEILNKLEPLVQERYDEEHA